MKPKFDPAVHDDNPPLSDERLARMRPATEVLGQDFVDRVMRTPGRPKGSTKADAKVLVTLRLDPDVLAHFRTTGPGWQTRINDTLAAAMKKAG